MCENADPADAEKMKEEMFKYEAGVTRYAHPEEFMAHQAEQAEQESRFKRRIDEEAGEGHAKRAGKRGRVEWRGGSWKGGREGA
jgi:hypothetical protein